jgi:hypothetical protein
LSRTQNGPGRAPQAASAINGTSGPSKESINAHPAAQDDDLSYFRANPGARTRIRAAFTNELPRALRRRARGRQLVVLVAVERDASGQPTTRARGVFFADGGTA